MYLSRLNRSYTDNMENQRVTYYDIIAILRGHYDS